MCLLTVIVMACPLLAGQVSSAKDKPTAYNLYFGDLHTHTGYSDSYDAESTPWDAFEAAVKAGADFMAVTDHLQIWNAYDAFVIDEEEWADTLAAADYYTSKRFVAMPGYEAWLLANCGEINVYNTRELPPKQTLGNRFDRLPVFYDWLAAQEGAVGQFNHPLYVSEDFMDYDFLDDVRDGSMCVIEVYNTNEDYQGSYTKALDAGWHLMPSANSDTHYADWIASHEMRSVLLAPSLTPEDLYDAIRACRGYATLDRNLEVRYELNGAVMGSVLPTTGTDYVATVSVFDPDGSGDGVTKLEIVTDEGKVAAYVEFEGDDVVSDLAHTFEFSSDSATYFYLRVTTESPMNGEVPGVTVWTAPVWTGR